MIDPIVFIFSIVGLFGLMFAIQTLRWKQAERQVTQTPVISQQFRADLDDHLTDKEMDTTEAAGEREDQEAVSKRSKREDVRWYVSLAITIVISLVVALSIRQLFLESGSVYARLQLLFPLIWMIFILTLGHFILEMRIFFRQEDSTR